MIPIEVDKWHGEISGRLKVVKERVGSAVRNFCDSRGYAYSGRIKESRSLCEKLETGRASRIDEVDDLFGCSIIISSLNEEPEVLESLKGMFDCHKIRHRTDTDKSPDVFRFEATRFIGRLRPSDPDESSLSRILFEIQVRTAFEHAWSVATHGPAYKSDTISWELERLAAQMKALVEQLDSLAVSYSESAATLVRHPHSRTDAAAKILEAFRGFETAGLIPEESVPEKWGLFAKNVVSLANAADWGQHLQLEEKVDRIISSFGGTLQRTDPSQFPFSITLFQYVLGSLIQSEMIKTKMRKKGYYPLITSALEQFFPKTRGVTPRCELT
jgi:ppGpp synthetase/RelA/SpoT-type nucleotidyltranferase